MRRIILLFTAFLFTSAALYAIPARKKLSREVVMSNGTAVQVTLQGDEFSHWWADGDGNCYTVDDKGLASLLSEDEVATLQTRAATRKDESNERRVARLPRRSAPRKAAYTGTKKGLVILVSFANLEMSRTTAHDDFNRMFNETGYNDNGHIGSVSEYFNDQSYGQFKVDFDVAGPVQVSQNYEYYGQNDYTNKSGSDMYPCTMVAEACRLVDDEVDFSQYDWDGDGEVDQVFLIYAGYGEHYGASSNTIWPHEWALSSGRWYGDGEGSLTLDGVKVDTYAVTSELGELGTNNYAGMGTACHEFSHCLGFPDFYDTSYSGGWGMQEWDLLDAGAYNGPGYDGEVPSGYTSYERWEAGWLEPTILSAGMEVSSLAPLDEEAAACVLFNDVSTNEYYLLENRSGNRWFSYIYTYPAPSGLLVLHVDYSSSAWRNNTPNKEADHQRMTIFQANNKKGTLRNGYYYLSREQYEGHVYPSTTLDEDTGLYMVNDSLTANSTPCGTVYNESPNGTFYMDKGIYDITRHDDGTISFSCGTTTWVDPVILNNGEILFRETFNQCSGTGGNDGVWSGSSTAEAGFLPDNEGWDGTEYRYGGYQCARFGKSGYPGHAITPTFTLNGTATLSFNIGIWDLRTEGCSVDFYLNDTAIEIYKELDRGQWTTLSYEITAYGPVFINMVGEGRFFLDEVLVAYPKTTDGIEIRGITDRVVGDEATRIYNLSGQYVGTSFDALPAGIYIRNGKKEVKR